MPTNIEIQFQSQQAAQWQRCLCEQAKEKRQIVVIVVTRYGEKWLVENHLVVGNAIGLLSTYEKFSIRFNKVVLVVFARADQIYHVARMQQETATITVFEH